jgi:hypothetical protein
MLPLGPPLDLARLRCVGPDRWSWGVPQPPGYREHFAPVRVVRNPVHCCLCWGRIERAAPGARTGERGTKAYFEGRLGLWLCLECRGEHTRAELAAGAER